MPTRESIIKQVREQDRSFTGMSDDKIISLMKKAQPDLVIDEEKSFLSSVGSELTSARKEIDQGIVDFSSAGVTGIDNLLTDITNLTVGNITGKEYNPIREILVPTGEKYEGGLLQRTADRGVDFGKNTWAGAVAETQGKQSTAESVYQMGGEVAKFATGTFGDIIGSGLSTVAPDKLETKVKNLVNDGLTKTKTGQAIVSKMTEFESNMETLKDIDPEAYRNYKATFDLLGAGFEAIGLKKVSGMYRMADGEIKHIPFDKVKELTQQATAKLEEGLAKTREFITSKKDQSVSKTKEILGDLPSPSKEYQKAISSNGTEFEVEKTPTLFENFNDAVFTKKNEEMAVQSIFPKQTKEKGISARLGAGKNALKGVEQLYDDKARGIVKSNINEMGGGVEGVQEGLNYWGKVIGELTDVDTTINFSKEIDTLAKSLDENFAKLNPEMHSRVSKVVNEFRAVGDEASIKDLQKGLSNIKSDVFSDFKVTKELAGTTTGKALGNLLDTLTDKFNATLDIVTGNSKQLKEAKSKYRNYLTIQKDLTDSFITAQRNAGKGLAGTAGKIGGAYELINNPSLSGVVKGILLKQSGELISKAKSRDGNWEMLMRNLDRKAVRDFNLNRKNAEKSNNLKDNNNTDYNNNNSATSRGDNDISLDNKRSIKENEIIEFVQDIAKQLEESIGDKDALIAMKAEINDIDMPERYKTILDEKVDSYIRDVDNYQKEIDSDVNKFGLEDHYGSDLTKAFNRLEGIEKRTKTTKGGDKLSTIEFESSPAYKTFSDNAQEFLGDNFDNLSVQEVFEQMKDFAGGVKFQTKADDLGKIGKEVPEDLIKRVKKKLKEQGREFVGEDFDLTPAEYFKKIGLKKEDGVNNILGLKKSKLREGQSPISENGNDTGLLARERFNIENLEKIGAGSDRVVYDLGDDKVIKIVKTARGIDQTEQGLDFYLQNEGIIPEVFESGKNYVVAEKFRQFKDLDKSEKKTLNEFIEEMGEIRKLADKYELGQVHERLGKYGWEALADFDLQAFGWNDIAKRNLSMKDGKPVLIDEGTINLQHTLDNAEGITNFQNPEFKDIVLESRRLKKEFGDTDKNTMFQKTELEGQGGAITQADSKKIVQKYFDANQIGVEFIDKIITPEGFEALGKYRDKIITFSKDPLESTPEHEVLHAFFDVMTPESRQAKVLSEVKKNQNLESDLDAEEWLADNFVNFVRDRDVSGIADNVKQFFGDMKRGLKTIFFEGDVIDNLYRDLEDLTKQKGFSTKQALAIGAVTDDEE